MNEPVLFVTNQVPPDRVGAFAALRRRVPQLDLVTFGGKRVRHATADTGLGRRVAERDVHRIARDPRYAAVVCGTAGRVALPAAYAGAKRARTPFVLWASLWAHPRTPAHALSLPAMLAIYRGADAVVTYGEHVSAYVRRRGARNVRVAPQAVDQAFWAAPATPPPDLADQPFVAVFAGRADAPEKGLDTLRDAWRRAAIEGRLVVARNMPPEELRNIYAAAHVLVVPSRRTRTFREPWGLVANEAMHQRTAIIASDQVGAVAGGLVRHERNGLVFAAADAEALAAALRRAADDPKERSSWADNATRDAAPYTHEAWAASLQTALREVSPC